MSFPNQQYCMPCEYIPLNRASISQGDVFGPVYFSVKKTSFNNHIKYYKSNGVESLIAEKQQLSSFQMWSLIRVLSSSGFNKINEVVSLQGERIIYKRAKIEEVLIGHVLVKRITNINGLTTAVFHSRTLNENDDLLMQAKDVILLANDCNIEHVRNQISTSKLVKIGPQAIYSGYNWDLKMRFIWDPEIWINNIHTIEYATQLGYKKELVEGPVVADLCECIHVLNNSSSEGFKMKWKYLGPLYNNLKTYLWENQTKDEKHLYTLANDYNSKDKEIYKILEMEVSNGL